MRADLPNWVVKSPQLFYVAAVAIFFGYFALGLYEIREAAFQYGSGKAVQLANLRVLLDSAREGAYMLGTGTWLHVAIAIWRQTGRVEPEAAE